MNIKAVRPYSIKGKILCGIIQFLCRIVGVFKGDKWLVSRAFEENPRTMNWKDLIYFSYKYYYKPPLLPENKKVEEYFSIKQNVTVSELFSNESKRATISFGGDLMPYRLINKGTCRSLWDKVGNDFFSSDIVFANLETPLDVNRKPAYVPEVMLNNMLFNTDEATFEIFSGNGKYKGYQVLSTANNHTMDMGERGVWATTEFLQSKGITSIGTNANNNYENKITEVNGIRIGWLAYTYSLNQFEVPIDKPWMVNCLPLNAPNCNLDLVKKQCIALKNEKVDLIIASIHAGNAYQLYPSSTTVDVFERIFNECGVDIIIGSHPHNLQPWKWHNYTCPFTKKIKKGFVIYSMADFIAYDIFTWCQLCAIVKVNIEKRNDEINFKVEVKPTVMHRDKVGNLQLIEAEEYFGTKYAVNKRNELADFYQRIKLLSD